MKTKTKKIIKEEKEYAKDAVGFDPEDQGEEIDSATPEEVEEFLNKNNPPVVVKEVFYLKNK